MVIYKLITICKKEKCNTYGELTKIIVGQNRIVNYTINNIINIFLLISYLVMIAGIGSFFKQEYNMANIYGALLAVILTAIILKKGIEGISKVNLVLIPFIIISICLLLINNKAAYANQVVDYSNSKWILSSILYASYNSIILIPIIINLNSKIKGKREAVKIVAGTLLITMILSNSIFTLILKNYNEAKNVQMPIIYLASKLGRSYKTIYSIVVLAAIFTTAISSGYSFLTNCTNNKKQEKILIYVISILGLALSPIGFGKLLDLLYPILGYLGLIQIFLILVS